jgi:hypothetical protein
MSPIALLTEIEQPIAVGAAGARKMINLIDIAPSGRWESARLVDEHHGTEIANLQWNVPPGQPASGFAGLRQGVTCEDGKNYDALHMHPRWSPKGTIKGWLPWVKLPAGAVFRAKVGFLAGAGNTDGVRFQVWEHHRAPNGREVWNSVLDLHKRYDGELVEVVAELSHLSGRDASIELRVDAGDSSGQDWAVWVAPRIETRTGPNARFWTIRASSLTVHDRQETRRIEGQGDEPYLGAIYFRSIVGKPGSTKVKTLTKLKTLGHNVKAGRNLAIPADAELMVTDVSPAWSDLGSLLTNGLTIMGFALVAMEEDKRGKSDVREELKKVARKLKEALVTEIEPNLSALLSREKVMQRIKQAVGGGHDRRRFLEWLFRGDDVIGKNTLQLVGMTDGHAQQLAEDSYTPDAAMEPLSGLTPRSFDLEFKGKGARYVVRVDLKEEEHDQLV